jgi:NADH:ubiquinone oxidoreductase subunit 5 (subunit L)/multisubunit Na+/H+ antiporter MnhA subunit
MYAGGIVSVGSLGIISSGLMMIINVWIATLTLFIVAEGFVGFISSFSLLWVLWLLVVVSSADVLYAVWYGWSDSSAGRLILLLLFFTLGMLIIIVSSDGIILFVGWEMIGVASYLLVGYYGGTRSESFSAALKALGYNVLGDVGMLFSLVLCLAWTGSSCLIVYGMDSMTWCGLGCVVGGWCKSALFGMHGWLLDAMEGPTPVSALLHSATLVTAGALGVLKMSGLWLGNAGLMMLLLILGLTSVVVSALHALWLLDVKRVVASSTCLHLAVSFLGLGCGCMSLVLFYLLLHGLVKALLFFMVGMIIHSCHSQDSRSMSSSHSLVVLLLLSFLIVTGVVGSGLGLLKDLLLMEGFISVSILVVVVLLLAQLYSVLSILTLDLSSLSRFSDSLAMLILFITLLVASVIVGLLESVLFIEFVDLGMLPYLALLLISVLIQRPWASSFSSDHPLSNLWQSRLFLESSLSYTSSFLITHSSLSSHHSYLALPLASHPPRRCSFIVILLLGSTCL